MFKCKIEVSTQQLKFLGLVLAFVLGPSCSLVLPLGPDLSPQQNYQQLINRKVRQILIKSNICSKKITFGLDCNASNQILLSHEVSYLFLSIL